jgi:hypothetical protein
MSPVVRTQLQPRLTSGPPRTFVLIFMDVSGGEESAATAAAADDKDRTTANLGLDLHGMSPWELNGWMDGNDCVSRRAAGTQPQLRPPPPPVFVTTGPPRTLVLIFMDVSVWMDGWTGMVRVETRCRHSAAAAPAAAGWVLGQWTTANLRLDLHCGLLSRVGNAPGRCSAQPTGLDWISRSLGRRHRRCRSQYRHHREPWS